jgi:hypothetical protein
LLEALYCRPVKLVFYELIVANRASYAVAIIVALFVHFVPTSGL